MGALNEFIRKKEGRYRTMDPLLSLSVPIEWKDYFQGYEGHHSLGAGGGLDAVHHMAGVKFLFLGAEMGDCFTYVHYVEKMLDVPYRFDMQFLGNVIDETGNQMERIQYIHTQCSGITLPPKYDYFEQELAEEGKEVEMHCHFCNKRYTFSVEEVEELMKASDTADSSKTKS